MIDQPLDDGSGRDDAQTAAPATPAAAPAPMPATRWKPWFFTALVAALVLDLASKWWLFSLPINADLPHWLDRTVNPGVAWGVFGGFPLAVVAMTVGLIPLLTWVWWRHFRLAGAFENLAFGLILGGALGNGYDRVTAPWRDAWHGVRGVRDFFFVDLKAVGIDYEWPNFNVADSAICVGFFLLVLLAFRRPSGAGSAATG